MRRYILLSGVMLELAVLASAAGVVLHLSSWVLLAELATAALCAALLLAGVLSARSMQGAHPMRLKGRNSRGRGISFPLEDQQALIQELVQEKEKLQTILDCVPSSFVLMDADRRILAASKNFESVTGRMADEIAGKHCSMQLWSNNVCNNCPAEASLRSGRQEQETVKIENPDGNVRYFEHNSIPVRKNDRLFGVLETITDVTDRMMLQSEVVRAEKLSTAGELSAVVAHEIRNSLTSVRMILQLLKEDVDIGHDDNGAETGEAIEVALRSLGHSEAIIRQLLHFARPAPPRKEPTDIAPVLETCIELVRRQFDRDVDLQRNTRTNLPRINVDPHQIEVAVVNLLLNACQAVHPGGTVQVGARPTTLKASMRDVTRCWREPRMNRTGVFGRVDLDFQEGTEVLCVEVIDNGPGILADRLERILDPFYTTKIDGTGLGLAMVKRIVDEHGGILTVSNLEPGCRFSIVFPLASSPSWA